MTEAYTTDEQTDLWLRDRIAGELSTEGIRRFTQLILSCRKRNQLKGAEAMHEYFVSVRVDSSAIVPTPADVVSALEKNRD